MAGITLEQAEAKLQTWMEAEEKIASGQGYSIGDRRLTRADLSLCAVRSSFGTTR